MNWLSWALLSALFAALTALTAKLGVNEIEPNVATAIRTTVILILAWGLAATSATRADWSLLSVRAGILLAVSGLLTGLSWICYFRALKLGDLAKVAPVDKLSVALAILLAVFFLGERIKVQEGIGAVLIILGVVVMVVRL